MTYSETLILLAVLLHDSFLPTGAHLDIALGLCNSEHVNLLGNLAGIFLALLDHIRFQ